MFYLFAILGIVVANGIVLAYARKAEAAPVVPEEGASEEDTPEVSSTDGAWLKTQEKRDVAIIIAEIAQAELEARDYPVAFDGATMIAAHAGRETGYKHWLDSNLFGVNARPGEPYVEGTDAGNARKFRKYDSVNESIGALIDLLARAYPLAYTRLGEGDPRAYAWALKFGQPGRSYYELDFEAYASGLEKIYNQVEAWRSE